MNKQEMLQWFNDEVKKVNLDGGRKEEFIVGLLALAATEQMLQIIKGTEYEQYGDMFCERTMDIRVDYHKYID